MVQNRISIKLEELSSSLVYAYFDLKDWASELRLRCGRSASMIQLASYLNSELSFSSITLFEARLISKSPVKDSEAQTSSFF